MPDPVQAASSTSLLASFAGTLGGAAVPLSLLWVKLRLDQLSSRCDVFVKSIEETSKIALDYWLLGDSRELGVALDHESDKVKELKAKAERLEIQLRGIQTVVQLDILRLSREIPKSFRPELQREFADFISALTGGKFGDRDGLREPMKARAAMASAARIIRVVRTGRDDVTKPTNFVRFLFGWL